MEHVTIGKKYGEGKVAYVECVRNGDLTCTDIRGKGFLLVCLWEGSLRFSRGRKTKTVSAPCFLCFDEGEDPIFRGQQTADYACIWFHPKFLNVNMSLSRIRSAGYEDLAMVHDLFLLRPFLEGCCAVPCSSARMETVKEGCIRMEEELTVQRDWYWSCRSRSFFMEILIALEREYASVGYKNVANEPYGEGEGSDALRRATAFLEGAYAEEHSMESVCNALEIPKSALTSLFRKELGMTVMEYLTSFRVKVAKKHLAFTEVPQKEIALRCGFKTVQHFSRVFKSYTGQTPAEFRKNAVQKRKDELQ